MKTFFAPAKINVVLRVLGRRPNGYHDLQMLNVKLSVGDDIGISVSPSSIASEIGEPAIKITSNEKGCPCDETNLCAKAARAIFARMKAEGLKLPEEISIHIEKRTPVAAGLGGGSSDGSAVLKGLNELLGLGWSNKVLAELGVKLGADCPFFLYEGSAICEGIGEEITTLSPLPKMWILLINPNFAVSTKWVYETFDQETDLQLTAKNERASLPRLFKGLTEVAQVVHNDLELVTARKYPEIERIKQLLVSAGALRSWMSGSGPTVVGLFADKLTRDGVVEKVEGRGWRVIATESL